MADYKHQQLEIGLEFAEGSSEPKKDIQVIQVQGRQPHKFLNSNYLLSVSINIIINDCTFTDTYIVTDFKLTEPTHTTLEIMQLR